MTGALVCVDALRIVTLVSKILVYLDPLRLIFLWDIR